MARGWAVVIGVGAALVPAGVRGGEWPQFRGPNGAGVTAEKGLPAEWGADKNLAWKVEVPGVAWSSPVVWGDKVFVTTAVSDKQAKPKPGGGFGFGGGPPGERPRRPRPDGPGGEGNGPPGGGFPPGGPRGMGGGKPPDAVYRWEVYCLGRADGKVLWKQVAAEHKPTYPINPSNTYASETPATDGERVYAYFGMTGLFCYDLDGKPLWSKEPGTFKMMLGFGTGSSPALDAGRLYVQCDNEQKSFLVALDKRTGKELWRADRKEKSSWSTPFVWKNKVRTEVVACGGGGFGGKSRVVSYDPATGAELWQLGGIDGGFNASPVASEELLFFGTGGPRGDSPLFAVKAGASGDVTPKEGEPSGAGVAWRRKQAGPYTSSPLLYEGYLYVVGQRGGLLSCYEAATGKPAYEKARLPGAKGFTASPWAYDGKVFLLDESGKTYVVRAGPEFKLLNTNSLDEMFWSSPAVSGGCLFLRGVDHLYCVKAK